MEREILPIGSICTLKNDDKKILIVGLYSVVYDNDIIVYDYQGCSYPEGLTLSDKIYSFNHNEINEIIHVGYENEEFKKLHRKLVNGEDETSPKEKKGQKFINNNLSPIEEIEEERTVEILILE